MSEDQSLLDRAFQLHQSGRIREALDLYNKALPGQGDNDHLLYLTGMAHLQIGQAEQAIGLLQSSLVINPANAFAHHYAGVAFHALRRLDEALASYDRAVAIKPDYAEAFINRGNVLRELRRLDEALASYDKAAAARPGFAAAHSSRGIVLREQGRWDDALASYDKALAIEPGFADAHNNRGNVLRDLKRWDEALASYGKALTIDPAFSRAHSNRGNVLQDLKRWDEALTSYDKALAIEPDYVEALLNRGTVLHELKRYHEALASYDKALAIRPGLADACCNRGNILRELRRLDEALASYDRALAIKPDHAAAHGNRGMVLKALKRPEEALASYDKALAIKPDYALAYSNRGIALQDLNRMDEALASYGKALAINPGFAEAYSNRGIVLQELGDYGLALADFEKAISVDPDHRYAAGRLADLALRLCDWKRVADFSVDLQARVRDGTSIIEPLTLLGYSDDAALQLACARHYLEDRISSPPQPLWNGAIYHHDKIRIAYLSSDFRKHAVACLSVELYERHDRARFDVIGVSLGEDDGSEIRARLIRAFDQFHDVRSQSDLEVARLLRRLEVDIAVDLNGHTRHSRPEILSHRPCPVQVNYLGYPGTMGAGFMDYIIADERVLPAGQAAFFTEKVVHLPDCYLPGDSGRAISPATPARRELGLPEKGFVFCCFNNSWKISAPVFDVWMRLLASVPGSVLWLIADNPETRKNLIAEAAARGIDQQRLVFAPRVRSEEDHLARYRAADLFLDTLPYNAHATASDALWAGLPLLTCRGGAFAGRVAASLLTALGMPELVTENLQDYEALALRLARDPQALTALRHTLQKNRLTHPLFDADRFRRAIEKAYTGMWAISQRGDGPQAMIAEPDLAVRQPSV